MLQVRNIKKAYGGVPVLQDISFVLPDGMCLGIRGENGCGKSTLLRILAGLEKAEGGSVLLDGKNLAASGRLRRGSLGYVPQSVMLAEGLTVKEQLKLWQSACGLGGRLPEDILSLLGLEPLLRSKTGVLSGGQQKRVSLAMAFLAKPKLLLMDEATASLDSAYSEKLMLWLKTYLGHGGSIVWCSHRPEEFGELAGTVLCMKDGKLG